MVELRAVEERHHWHNGVLAQTAALPPLQGETIVKRMLMTLCAMFLLAAPALAQEATPSPESYPFQFPVEHPTKAQIAEAHACDLNPPAEGTTPEATPAADTHDACGLGVRALSLARARGDSSAPSAEEIKLLEQIAAANPALLLDINLLVAYYNAVPLVAPPDFASQPIRRLTLHYSFVGLSGGTNYDFVIEDADTTPRISGTVKSGSRYESEETAEPPSLPKTVDGRWVQAFGPALRDLLPIARQFRTTPCWDYYPDWVISLEFADSTTLKMVTNNSNAVGIGGPWQVEINGKNYMQYSAAFAEALRDLFKALDLPFGQTVAMGCGGADNPLDSAFPVE
jgi:hypothetical protein